MYIYKKNERTLISEYTRRLKFAYSFANAASFEIF